MYLFMTPSYMILSPQWSICVNFTQLTCCWMSIWPQPWRRCWLTSTWPQPWTRWCWWQSLPTWCPMTRIFSVDLLPHPGMTQDMTRRVWHLLCLDPNLGTFFQILISSWLNVSFYDPTLLDADLTNHMCNLLMLFNAIYPDVGRDNDHDDLDDSNQMYGPSSLARHVTNYDAFNGVLHSTCLVSNTGAKINHILLSYF